MAICSTAFAHWFFGPATKSVTTCGSKPALPFPLVRVSLYRTWARAISSIDVARRATVDVLANRAPEEYEIGVEWDMQDLGTDQGAGVFQDSSSGQAKGEFKHVFGALKGNLLDASK